MPGHEFAGIVTEAGADVVGFTRGDYVTADPMVHRFGLGDAPGAFTRFLRITGPELGRTAFKLPVDLPPKLVSLVEPIAVGLHGVAVAKAQPDDRALVLGAGTIGLCVAIALRAQGVFDITVRDPSPLRRAAAEAVGATAMDTAQPLPRSADQADKPTLIFDCAGVGSALLEAQDAIADGGRTVILASYAQPVLLDLHELMLRESAVLGAVGYGGQFPAAIAMVVDKRAVMERLISHYFALEQIREAFSVQGDPLQSLKVIVEIGDRYGERPAIESADRPQPLDTAV
ncbi:hypothetical protein WP12_10900 [Sphingomonas sp. SRS2]|nr:hypothetical protein WP12_10900 [Sphingomonas sp. SRS2]